MFNVLRTSFAIGMIVFFIWTINLSYHRWFEAKESVLDKYAEPAEESAFTSDSLDELERKYAELHKKIKAYESDEKNPVLSEAEKETTEPYMSESMLRSEIQLRETHAEDVYKVRYYWLCGLAFVISGIAIFTQFNTLLGLPLMFAGFLEMFESIEPARYGSDFSSVLTNKIVFSIWSIILLIITGYLIKIMRDDQESSEDS
jgi:hypothetical protein